MMIYMTRQALQERLAQVEVLVGHDSLLCIGSNARSDWISTTLVGSSDLLSHIFRLLVLNFGRPRNIEQLLFLFFSLCSSSPWTKHNYAESNLFVTDRHHGFGILDIVLACLSCVKISAGLVKSQFTTQLV